MSRHSAARLALAQQAADDARLQLGETLSAIQEKFTPSNMIAEIAGDLRVKGQQIFDDAVTSVSSRPVLATIAASGLGWLLSSRPGLALLLKLFLRGSATSRLSRNSTSSRTRPRRASRPRGRAAEGTEETA